MKSGCNDGQVAQRCSAGVITLEDVMHAGNSIIRIEEYWSWRVRKWLIYFFLVSASYHGRNQVNLLCFSFSFLSLFLGILRA